MTKDFGGVVIQLVAGEWKHPHTGQAVPINIRSIVIKDSLEGMEAALVAPLHENEKLAVVSDRYTYEVLGRRIGSALQSEGFDIEEIVWKKPHADIEKVSELRHLTRHCDGLIAVGSGKERHARLREEYHRYGLNGERIVLLDADRDQLDLPPYMASLVMIADTSWILASDMQSESSALFEVLRPYGGVSPSGLPLGIRISAAARAGISLGGAGALRPSKGLAA